uniref:Uncharacterized protein n=1 Tax=Arundo donax TaxID=35708 RepID=A0A0A9FE99_ARUDO
MSDTTYFVAYVGLQNI